jgi:hypothetical protein
LADGFGGEGHGVEAKSGLRRPKRYPLYGPKNLSPLK